MAPALVLCRRRSKAGGGSVCLSVRRLRGGARRCFQATRCPFQTPARRGESPTLRWRGRVLLLGENALGGSRARKTGRGCFSVQGASKFSWWPGEEPGRSHFALAEVCGITQRTRVAPFIPPIAGARRAPGLTLPPDTQTPPFFQREGCPQSSTPSARDGDGKCTHVPVSHPAGTPRRVPPEPGRHGGCGIPAALTLLAGQRLRFSVQTLQVVVAPLLVLLQRALLLVAPAAVVALVGFADGGGGDCKTGKPEPGRQNRRRVLTGEPGKRAGRESTGGIGPQGASRRGSHPRRQPTAPPRRAAEKGRARHVPSNGFQS